jgi:translation elongation factor EF-Tu-like GTPase
VNPPYVLVRVRFFTPSEGGRDSPVVSPYRAPASFDEDRPSTMHDVELRFLDTESVEPGDQVRARLIPASPESWPARQRGQRIRIHEGRKHVGDAYVEEAYL